MRYLSIIFALVFFAANAQRSKDSNITDNFALSVILPETTDDLDYGKLNKLKTKIQQITARHGITGVDYSSNFIVYPEISIYGQEVINAGLEPAHSIEGEITFFVAEALSQTIYNSITLPLKGVGASKEKALLRAISSIRNDDRRFNGFFSDSKSRIISFYNEKCDVIIKKAEFYGESNQFPAAISLLMSIPQEATFCYNSSLELASRYYNSYQDEVCNDLIIKANSQAAQKNYSQALALLASISSTSTCKNKALRIINSLEGKVSDEEDKQIKLLMTQWEAEIDLEKDRIGAMKEVAKAFYTAQAGQNDSKIYLVN